MLNACLLELLCCPLCRGPLNAALDPVGDDHLDGELWCAFCHETYPVHGGIPDLVPRDADLSQEEWKEWRDHLKGFQARRELRKRDRLAARLASAKSSLKPAFARFIHVSEGPLLDVGCGPGRFRAWLPEGVEYFGIDPIPLPEAAEFPFARALAEHIPFPDGTFAHVIVMAALDHFKDPASFFREAHRVLRPTGRLHIVQTLHEQRGSLPALTHWIKDTLEDRLARKATGGVVAPHHMSEFDHSSIRDAYEDRFQVAAERIHTDHWFSPSKLFLTLLPVRIPAVHVAQLAGPPF